uniref:A kinase (PRKA) anchor protein 12b n=1 Tax=Lepisosteus oculatus TaxID=7918 RepID=W5NHK0_LEPOC
FLFFIPVGQGDSAAVSQKEEEPEKMEDLQEEAEPQVNGEKEDQDSPAANDITPKEETPKEEKANEASEVGFKKVFKFVGFKFTVKKDKTEKTEPVQLLTVKKEEGEEKSLDVTEDAKGDESKTEAKAKVPEEQEVTKTADEPAGTESPSEKVNGDATEKVAQQTEPSEDVKPEKEVEKPAESPTSPLQEIQSPLKRFFTQGLFSSLKKKTPFKKTKEEEVTAEEEPLAQEESKTSPLPETAPLVVIEQKEDEIKVEIEVAPKVTQEDDEKTSDFQNAVLEEPTEVTKEVESVEEHPVMKEESQESEATTESKTTEEHVPDTLEEQQKSEHPSPDDTPTAKTPETVTTEAEILSSQEKAKVQGSPLKKLFTGTGLKKLSGKKQKGKKENEAKLAESGENVIEQIQSSTESAEVQKSDSSPSSPEESTERFIGEEAQAETPGPDVEGDGATSDGERKRDGITPWASFKKLVTPKKRVKRPSESDKEDDANEKPKSATMSSTESSGSTEKPEEPKPSEEEQKMERSIEEPKKKVDTSVSWEALICVGSSKKRARKTSDSDDESPKIEEEAQNLGEESAKNKEAAVESPIASSQEADQEQLASSPDQAGSPSDGEGVSTWESFKRLVTPRRKAKLEDKPEESPAVTTEQIPSDSEAGKEESTFSLKKLIPGRRKKRSDAKPEQAPADEADKAVGSAEEDSDTPAVVPLSEYDTEQIDATVKIEATAEVKPEQQEETQTKAIPDMDERSPSWISATVTEEIIQEQIESISKHQPLSDIPEEVAVEETTITRSPTEVEDHISPDDTIAQDIMELTSEAVTALEQAPEESFAEETTEMVSAVSRLTESPGTSGDATPVPGVYEVKQTDKILQEVAENIKLTPIALSVTNTTEQPEETVVVTVPHLMASAVKEDPIVMQKEAEAVAICTGLSTQEIEAVETNLQKSTVEVITLVMEAISTEVVAEEKTETFQEAGAVEEEVCNAEVQDIKTEYQEVEQQVEEKLQEFKEVKDLADLEVPADEVIQCAAQEVVASIPEAPTSESSEMKEASFAVSAPAVEPEVPAVQKEEELICASSVEVTETSVIEEERVQEFKEVKDLADLQVPVENVIQCAAQEVVASMPEALTSESSETKEAPFAVSAPAIEAPVVKETVGILKPPCKTIKSEVAEDQHTIDEAATLLVEAAIGAVTGSLAEEKDEKSELGAQLFSVPEKSDNEDETGVCEKQGETGDVTCEQVEMHERVIETIVIEKQSTMIVQQIIQNVVENLTEKDNKVEEKSQQPVSEEVQHETSITDVQKIVEEVQIETAGAVDNKTEELPVKDDVQQDVAKTDVKTEKLVEDTEIDPPVVKDKQIEKDSTSGVSHDASIDAQGQKTLQCDVSAVEDLSCQTEIKEELQAQKDLVEDAKSLETAREDDICQKATLESVQTESVSKEVTESPTEAIEETRSTVLVDGETVSKADVVQDQMLSSESEQSTVDVVEDVQIQAETSEKTEVKQDEPKEELETEITQEAEKETE